MSLPDYSGTPAPTVMIHNARAATVVATPPHLANTGGGSHQYAASLWLPLALAAAALSTVVWIVAKITSQGRA